MSTPSDFDRRRAGAHARKLIAPPTWLVVGAYVDYCSVIGEPPTDTGLRIRTGPDQLPSGHWVVWLEGKSACVSVDACKPSTIQVLWFDRKGCGPDELALQLNPLAAQFDGEIPASLGLMVRAGNIVIGASALIDGGFALHRDQVADLHRQLAAWLAENP